MTKKILILYTSVGLGHKFIAENIGYHLRESEFEVQLHDILEVQEGLLVDFGKWLHKLINEKFPFIWRWLYFSNLVNFIMLPIRVPLAKSNSQNLKKIIQEFKPDCIISTQTTASATVASLIRRKVYTGKFIVAFSDYHLHKFWLYDEADLYLANIEEQKQQMIELGIDENKIVVLGITLQPLVDVNIDEVKSRLSIPEDHQVILFASGSLGTGFDFDLLVEFLSELVERQSNLTVLVACGKNQELQSKIQKLSIVNVVALNFYKPFADLLALADLVITKPGGLTIAESLQHHSKILITHTLPGQEEPNYEYLILNDLVIPKPEPLTATNLVNTVLLALPSDKKSNQIAADKITQSPNEGKILVNAVKNLFHIV